MGTVPSLLEIEEDPRVKEIEGRAAETTNLGPTLEYCATKTNHPTLAKDQSLLKTNLESI
jgi:hypothetical protein